MTRLTAARHFWIPFFLALIAPAASIFLRWLMWAPPAHVLLYPDPDYGYLFNSLLLVDGMSPWHIDHPGTPVQLLGALVLKVRFWLFGNGMDHARDFFNHPVEYHQWAMHTLFGFFLSCQWYCGFRIARRGFSPILSVAVPLLPLTYFDLLDYFDHVSPECLLGGVSLLLAPIALAAATEDEVPDKLWSWSAMATGALLAVCCTLKATSIPLLILLFLLPGWHRKKTAFLSFLLFYLGITAPIWTEYPRMASWYLSLFQGQGIYGQASGHGMAEQLTYNFHWLLGGGQWNGVLPAIALFPLLLFWPAPYRRWPIALAAALLFLLILKHPGTRYVLPFIGLSAIALLRLERAHWTAALVASLVLLVPAPFVIGRQVMGVTGWRTQEALSAVTLDRKLNEPPFDHCNVTTVNELAHFSYALFAGNFATATGNYGEQLEAAHPRYNFIFNQVRSFDRTLRPADWEKFVKSAPCHLFIGRPERTPSTIEQVFHLKAELVELIGPGENSAIYRVRDLSRLHLKDQPKFIPAETPLSLKPLVSPL